MPSIKQTILNIEKEIASNQNENPLISLFMGTGAFSLFYHMLYQHTGQEIYENRFNGAIQDLYNRLNNEKFSFTYCDGLSGIAYLLNFYKRKNILAAEDIDDALGYFDDFILQNILNVINEADKQEITTADNEHDYLDFLHGILGQMYYLVTRVNSRKKLIDPVQKVFEKVAVIILEDMGEDSSPKLPFNCGISHGVGAEIVVYSKFLIAYPNHKSTKDFLYKCTARLLKYKSNNSTTYSQFPSIVYDENKVRHETPLGWCYGDQTVSIALHMAGLALNDDKLKNEALNIALKTTERNSVIKSSKSEDTDAGFCHGMASIAYINKRWYQITKDKRFNEQYQFFLQELLKRGMHKDSVSGYKKFLGEKGFEQDVGLLSGSTGIGIFLIDAISDSTLEWDELFLLR